MNYLAANERGISKGFHYNFTPRFKQVYAQILKEAMKFFYSDMRG